MLINRLSFNIFKFFLSLIFMLHLSINYLSLWHIVALIDLIIYFKLLLKYVYVLFFPIFSSGLFPFFLIPRSWMYFFLIRRSAPLIYVLVLLCPPLRQLVYETHLVSTKIYIKKTNLFSYSS